MDYEWRMKVPDRVGFCAFCYFIYPLYTYGYFVTFVTFFTILTNLDKCVFIVEKLKVESW